MFGTALTLSSCINSEAAGVAMWLQQTIGIRMQGYGAYAFLIAYMLLAVVVTNFINNAVVAAILIPLSYSFSVSLGLNPLAVCAALILFTDFGILLPSSSPSGAMLHNSCGLVPKKYVYQFGMLDLVLLVGLSLILAWPMANMLFK